MITLQQLCRLLDGYFRVQEFKDYCENGLQLEGVANIKRVATAVTASLDTIQKAVAIQAQALIVHHGLFWQGDSYSVTGSKKEKLAELIRHGISLIAYHLPLDAHEDIGNNWKAAKDLNWADLEPFGLYKGVYLGVKGTFTPVGVEQFQKKLENYYRHKATVALGGKKEVSSAALVSGGAYKLLSTAAEQNLDCFISGNFDLPAWYDAHEKTTNFFALGHTATERVGPMALCAFIEKKSSVECSFIDTENPF